MILEKANFLAYFCDMQKSNFFTPKNKVVYLINLNVSYFPMNQHETDF